MRLAGKNGDFHRIQRSCNALKSGTSQGLAVPPASRRHCSLFTFFNNNQDTFMAKKTTAIKERYTKTQIVTEIAENTELTKKDVQFVLDELSDLMERHLKKRSCGEFVLPGLMKIQSVKKPARKARPGVNPFTGEEIMIAAKPASTALKVRPLKKLKDMTSV
jgi:nucleoid DNA-binding protein